MTIMKAIQLEDLTISEIMKRWPATMRLLIDRRLLCVGCPIAPFHTLADIAFEYGVDCESLVAAVEEIAEADGATSAPASAHR